MHLLSFSDSCTHAPVMCRHVIETNGGGGASTICGIVCVEALLEYSVCSNYCKMEDSSGRRCTQGKGMFVVVVPLSVYCIVVVRIGQKPGDCGDKSCNQEEDAALAAVEAHLLISH